MGLTQNEILLIEQLRTINPAMAIPSYDTDAKIGEFLADRITALLGSWRFLLIQSALLTLWVIFNVVSYFQHWDPYPFILLNLMLSFQAAYTAPILLMSQNREARVDRAKLAYYYNVNLKQELEIELLHQKLDELLSQKAVVVVEKNEPQTI